MTNYLPESEAKRIIEAAAKATLDPKQHASYSESQVNEIEHALYSLGKVFAQKGKSGELADLVVEARTIGTSVSKAKTAKIIRNLVDLFDEIKPSSQAIIDTHIATLNECIEWAKSENRSFLRQSLQTRLVALFTQRQMYNEALEIVNGLLKELKRLDDKSSLVEVQLLETKVYHALRNIPKARACLTSARTSANAIYCPPSTQAALDMMSGILLGEDKDYKTAFSYFFEAFEGYAGQEDDDKAVLSLKYLLLSKIMLNLTDDINALFTTNKAVQKYAAKGGRDIESMRAIAKAHANRSLQEFESVLQNYKPELSRDVFIRSHFSALYDTLLEQNLVKVIEPFSCVEISHIANIIGLDTKQVEGKLSQMILDKVFYGVLDQGNGWLVVYDEPSVDRTYDLSLDTIKYMSNVVDLLYEKAAALN